MGMGPEDIYYEIDGSLVCSYDLGGCESWTDVEDLIGSELANQMQEAGCYRPSEADVFLCDSGYEQKFAK